jgi:hypothetical protein
MRSKLYTGGTDSLVRIWRTDKDGLHTEPDIAHEADEAITSIAISVRSQSTICPNSLLTEQ